MDFKFDIALIDHLVYYRVYTANGLVRSKNPIGPSWPAVGRISVDCIPPPHTPISIMRCIAKMEEHPSFHASQIFANMTSESPINDDHVPILTDDCPGSTPDDPIAFVASPFTQRMRVTQTWST